MYTAYGCWSTSLLCFLPDCSLGFFVLLFCDAFWDCLLFPTEDRYSLDGIWKFFGNWFSVSNSPASGFFCWAALERFSPTLLYETVFAWRKPSIWFASHECSCAKTTPICDTRGHPTCRFVTACLNMKGISDNSREQTTYSSAILKDTLLRDTKNCMTRISAKGFFDTTRVRDNCCGSNMQFHITEEQMTRSSTMTSSMWFCARIRQVHIFWVHSVWRAVWGAHCTSTCVSRSLQYIVIRSWYDYLRSNVNFDCSLCTSPVTRHDTVGRCFQPILWCLRLSYFHSRVQHRRLRAISRCGTWYSRKVLTISARG